METKYHYLEELARQEIEDLKRYLIEHFDMNTAQTKGFYRLSEISKSSLYPMVEATNVQLTLGVPLQFIAYAISYPGKRTIGLETFNDFDMAGDHPFSFDFIDYCRVRDRTETLKLGGSDWFNGDNKSNSEFYAKVIAPLLHSTLQSVLPPDLIKEESLAHELQHQRDFDEIVSRFPYPLNEIVYVYLFQETEIGEDRAVEFGSHIKKKDYSSLQTLKEKYEKDELLEYFKGALRKHRSKIFKRWGIRLFLRMTGDRFQYLHDLLQAYF